MSSVTAGGPLELSAVGDSDAKSTADGSAVGSGSAGIGAAVAITLANVVRTAGLNGDGTIDSHGLSVTTGMNGAGAKNSLDAEATSGAGAGTVGLAGSLAVVIGNLVSSAKLHANPARGPPAVHANAGDVTLSADASSESTAKALPKISGGTSFGLGAAVALNLITDLAHAMVDGATVDGANNLTVKSTVSDVMTTLAQTGAAGGGVSAAPGVALSISNVGADATIDSGPAISLTGNLLVSAALGTVSVSTTATGDVSGPTAALGASVAIALPSHFATASVGRPVSALGTATVQALGVSTVTTTATATATGAPGAGSAGTPGSGVDTLVSGERSHAEGVAGTPPGAPTPSAGTSAGGIDVAAAVAVNLLASSTTAKVLAGGSLSAGGAVSITSKANADATAAANGSATTGASAGIGAAVAINLANVDNAATVAGSVTGASVSIEASMNGSGEQHVLDAEATSGAGSGNVGVAGSLALNILALGTRAALESGSSATATTGALSLSAASSSKSTSNAVAALDGGGHGVGVGASVALNIDTEATTAEIADGVHAVAGLKVSTEAVELHEHSTVAKTGKAGGGVAVVPSVAVALTTIGTTSHIGSGPDLGPCGVTPCIVSITANQQVTVHTTASGDATAATAAVGAAVAVSVSVHTVTASIDRNVVGGGAVTVEADGASSTETDATASAKGAPEASSAGTAGHGRRQRGRHRALARGRRRRNAVGHPDAVGESPRAAASRSRPRSR